MCRQRTDAPERPVKSGELFDLPSQNFLKCPPATGFQSHSANIETGKIKKVTHPRRRSQGANSRFKLDSFQGDRPCPNPNLQIQFQRIVSKHLTPSLSDRKSVV